jgi:thymidine kinase
MFIVVDGLIAAGKSSLLKMFKDSFDCHCIFEPVDHWKETGNLERFYKALEIQDIENRSAQIYRFQTYVFQSRIERIIRELKNISPIVYNDCHDHSSLKISNSSLVFIERSIFSDRYIFMEMLYNSGMVTESDYNMYKNWWNLWSLVMPIKPDAFIYLNPSIDACLERYKARNREGENVDRDYQQQLKNKHDEYFKPIVQIENKETPCLNLETDVDFRDGEGKKYVVDTVKNFIDSL